MSGSATFTTVMSSSSMNVPRQTAMSVQRLVVIRSVFPLSRTISRRADLPPSAEACSEADRSSSARVFGIRIGVDVSWFFVLFLIIWSLSGYYGDLFPGEDGKAFGLATASALLFFLSILLHELGHAVVAIRNGIPISGIDLWMFGGVAKLERDTDSPGVEFRVAIAGPLVTLAIAVLCFGMAIGALGEPRQRGPGLARSRSAASTEPPPCSATSPRSTSSCCSST